MAITPVAITKPPGLHANLTNTIFARLHDPSFRIANHPVEFHKFAGDGVLTTVDVATGLTRVLAGIVFNITDGTDWNATVVAPHPTDPKQARLTAIPADTDLYLLAVWGDKDVAY